MLTPPSWRGAQAGQGSGEVMALGFTRCPGGFGRLLVNSRSWGWLRLKSRKKSLTDSRRSNGKFFSVQQDPPARFNFLILRTGSSSRKQNRSPTIRITKRQNLPKNEKSGPPCSPAVVTRACLPLSAPSRGSSGALSGRAPLLARVEVRPRGTECRYFWKNRAKYQCFLFPENVETAGAGCDLWEYGERL